MRGRLEASVGSSQAALIKFGRSSVRFSELFLGNRTKPVQIKIIRSIQGDRLEGLRGTGHRLRAFTTLKLLYWSIETSVAFT